MGVVRPSIMVDNMKFLVVKKIMKKRKSRGKKILNWLSETIPKMMGTTESIMVHTLFFVGIFALVPLGLSVDQVMLILTTVVSLEAIYLSLFIQMTVNKQGESLEDVEEDIDEIQKDVEDIEDNVDEMSEDIEEIQKKDLEEETEDDIWMNKISGLDKISADLARLAEDVSKLREVTETSKK